MSHIFICHKGPAAARVNRWAWAAAWMLLCLSPAAAQDEPPAINPFGPRNPVREDAVSGYVELSDGTIYAGKVYLTRDARLKIFDAELQREREVPLRVIRGIECRVEKQWREKEWRFRENANAQKVYTGRSYPARIYVHTITLHDGRTLSGPLSGVVYVDLYDKDETRKLILHKRDKGPIDSDFDAMVYVRTIELGDEAMQRGLLKAGQREAKDSGSNHTGSRPDR